MSIATSSNKIIANHNEGYNLSYTLFSEHLQNNTTTVLSFLMLHMPMLNKNEIDDWLALHSIYINGEKSNLNNQLTLGSTLTIKMNNHFEQLVNTQWQCVWQNQDIMAVYKPAPLAVSRTTRNLYNTLINLVRRQTPFYSAQLLHRLDIETSGLLLIAKNKASDMYWKPKIKQLIEEKVYHAIVQGSPDWQEFHCENELAERVDSAIRCKMYVVDPELPRDCYKKPKTSITTFKVLKRQNGYSLIECKLITGRKHQIRAHLAHLHLPIVGDKIYNHQGHYFLKRLQLEAGLSAADYHILKVENHLLRAVSVSLRLTPETDLIEINSNSFADNLHDEFCYSKTESAT
ncbi:MAG: 23S rRNA pseudouridine1911/1915/1917 synthase [Oceanospirillaceae bacterium]|jgi:23S rRNA pseudouridine1911/1915/1917 synthase